MGKIILILFLFAAGGCSFEKRDRQIEVTLPPGTVQQPQAPVVPAPGYPQTMPSVPETAPSTQPAVPLVPETIPVPVAPPNTTPEGESGF